VLAPPVVGTIERPCPFHPCTVGLLWRTRILTSAIPGLRSALECSNLISSNSFAHRLGTGNFALRLAPSPVGLNAELRHGRT
jgi:hypothetical protein